MVRRVLAVLAAVLCAGMAALGGWALVLAALAVLWRYHAVSWKQFGGITGDLAGWFCKRPSSGCWRRCVPASGEAAMIFITGPLYSGKRTLRKHFPASVFRTCRYWLPMPPTACLG